MGLRAARSRAKSPKTLAGGSLETMNTQHVASNPLPAVSFVVSLNQIAITKANDVHAYASLAQTLERSLYANGQCKRCDWSDNFKYCFRSLVGCLAAVSIGALKMSMSRRRLYGSKWESNHREKSGRALWYVVCLPMYEVDVQA